MLNRLSHKLTLCIAIILIPFSLLLWLMYSDYIRQINHDAEYTAQKTTEAVNGLLSYAEQANQTILAKPHDLTQCDNIVLALRKQVATVPYVRSVNLAQHGAIYCSSLYGAVHVQDEYTRYHNGKLLLLPGTLVKSNYPLIVVRNTKGNIAVLSSIGSIYFQSILQQQESPELLIALRIDDHWLSKDGKFSTQNPFAHGINHHTYLSSAFPFAIETSLNYPSFWQAFWHNNQPYIWGLFLLLCAFSAGIGYLLNKPYPFSTELKRALLNNEFIPYAQTIIDAKTRQVIGIEVLMRWKHPQQGLIRPDLFIPQAEESDLIIPMTSALFKQSASILSRYQQQLPAEFHIGFNITARHCQHQSLLDDVQAFLHTIQGTDIKLVLELTERQAIEHTADTAALFDALQALGVILAIDDFGTGHSTLNYFQYLHVGSLKIDRSFVNQIGEGSLSEHIIENIVDLGHRLSLAMVAEGVETEQQAQYLTERNVTYLQGYLFSKPAPLEQVLTSLIHS